MTMIKTKTRSTTIDSVAATGYRETHPHFLGWWLMTDLSLLMGPGLPPGVIEAGWSVIEDTVAFG